MPSFMNFTAVKQHVNFLSFPPLFEADVPIGNASVDRTVNLPDALGLSYSIRLYGFYIKKVGTKRALDLYIIDI